MNNAPLNPLRAGLLIMMLILIAGVLFFKYLPSRFDKSANESAVLAGNPELVSPKQFDSLMADPPDRWLLVNISEMQGTIGNTESMENIPPANLMNKKWLRKMRNASKVVILADHSTMANQTALILEMTGVDAMAVDAPAYIFSDQYVQTAHDSLMFQPSEKPLYTFKQVLKVLKVEDKAPVIEVKAPVPSAGGC